MTTETTTRKGASELAFAKLNESLRYEETAKAGGNPAEIANAERAVAEIRAEMERVREEAKAAGDEEPVVLVAPNRGTPYVRDCHGVEFRYGLALVSRSLAERYLDVLDGYGLEEVEE